MLARRAGETPDALAFGEGGERLSYGGLHAEAGTLAGGLARLGVGRGDRVVLFLPAGLDFIRVFFALQRLGAAPCAFAPGGPSAAAVRRAERVRPSLVLIAGPENEGLAQALTGAGLRCAELAECRGQRRRAGQRQGRRRSPSCSRRPAPPARRGRR